MEFEIEKTEEEQNEVSFMGAFSVIAKAMLGVGMLCLSDALRDSGWIMGLIYFAVCGAMGLFTMHLLNECARAQGYKGATFSSICNVVSPQLGVFYDVIVVIVCLGAALSYMIVWREGFLKLIGKERNFGWSALAVWPCAGLVAPFVLKKTLGNTAILNYFGLLCLVLAVCVGFYYKGDDAKTTAGPVSKENLINAIPSFFFAFCCHQSAFGVCVNLKDPTPRKLNRLIILAGILGYLLCLPAMIVPYINYGMAVQGPFFGNWPNTWVPRIVIFLVGLAQLLSVPLLLHPGKEACVNVIASKNASSKRRYALSLQVGIASIVLVTLLANFIPDLSKVITYVGILANNAVSFILPCYLYCMTFSGRREIEENPLIKEMPVQSSLKWVLSAGIGIFAVLLIPLVIFVQIDKLTYDEIQEL